MTMNLYAVTATLNGSDLSAMLFIASARSETEAVDVGRVAAVKEGVDPALVCRATFEASDISKAAFEFVDEQLEAYEPTLFQKCVDAACGDVGVARDVLQTIIDIEELSLVLAQEEA
jgi:hypothetical protein